MSVLVESAIFRRRMKSGKRGGAWPEFFLNEASNVPIEHERSIVEKWHSRGGGGHKTNDSKKKAFMLEEGLSQRIEEVLLDILAKQRARNLGGLREIFALG